jgi:hypothetical protein
MDLTSTNRDWITGNMGEHTICNHLFWVLRGSNLKLPVTTTCDISMDFWGVPGLDRPRLVVEPPV